MINAPAPTVPADSSTVSPEEALDAFRIRRQVAVTQPKGSLALVNTQWVDSEQTIYGVPGTWAPLPEGESGLRVTAAASDSILVDGIIVDGEAVVRGKDSDAPGEVTFSDTLGGLSSRASRGPTRSAYGTPNRRQSASSGRSTPSSMTLTGGSRRPSPPTRAGRPSVSST